jgi:hypothetical protein
MNRAFCEREDHTEAAARTGMIDPEIASHAQHCTVCADILLVTDFLHERGALADHERLAMPDVGVVWQKAQSRATQEAVRLALRPIRIMKIIAVAAFACSPWLGMFLPVGRELLASWSRSVDFNVAVASRLWPLMASESTILLASTGTLILLGLSSWYMLRQE